ncbi:sensor histidine kinase [Deinococcus cavernae]|uniref:histidine kinase n=1 Tax=Deinococcus cavernae TaxID=2320857 RepID=A0A418V7Q9_9DEIO|nr:HAMP domain-containing sensor histidine kinase [Deinococcus cavernae]RJF72119.1 sensor histidine kinase [Deinococcus cavernae]
MALSLRTRWGMWAALATGLSVLLVAAGLFFTVTALMRRSQEEKVIGAVQAVQNLIERQHDDFNYQVTGQVFINPRDLERIADGSGQRTGLELRLLLSSNGQTQNFSTRQFPSGVSSTLKPGRYELDDEYVLVNQLAPNAALTVLADGRPLQEARRAFLRALTFLLPLSLLLSLLVGWLVAGRLLAPVRRLEGAARRIGEGADLRQPLPGAGQGDELARLSLTLQDSFARLADSRDREQAFLRAAAHDLRSPLAALQARVDSTLARERDPERYRQDLREVGRDITRLSTLANHLLLLARDPSAMAKAPVPLRELAAEAVDRARELAPEADVDLKAPQPVTMTGDRVLLGQAIWNLTMNAVKHAPEATVTVSVQGQPDGSAHVTVQDNGPGVSADTLARLGEAFYRPDGSRTGDGHGLGLALARRAAELHGGQLTLESAPGKGFRATLHLPNTLPPGARLGTHEPGPTRSTPEPAH